eukprot:g1102.t1
MHLLAALALVLAAFPTTAGAADFGSADGAAVADSRTPVAARSAELNSKKDNSNAETNSVAAALSPRRLAAPAAPAYAPRYTCSGTTSPACKNNNNALCATSSQLPAAECDAWVDFFDGTAGTGWTHCSGNRLDPCACSYTIHFTTPYGKGTSIGGVSCQGSGANSSNVPVIDSLALPNNNLGGAIPDTIGQLTALILLDLHGNNVGGTIPGTIGQITYLFGLDLYDNKLTGLVPALPWKNYTLVCGIGGNPFICPLPDSAMGCRSENQDDSSTLAPTCTACPAGKYFTSASPARACSACPIGKYSTAPPSGQQLNQCTACAAGRSSARAGGASSAACDVACAAGTFAAAGAGIGCALCPVGRFSTESGAASCTACPTGRYTASAGAFYCVSDCAPGTFSSGAAGACASCPDGKYLSALTATTNSGPAAASSGLQPTCTACPSASCCPSAAALAYAPQPGAHCTELCAALGGAGGTRPYAVTSSACADQRVATAVLPCNTQPCDPNLLTPAAYRVAATPVLDQGTCGACYAFAAAEVYGARLAQPQSRPQPSPQWLVACNTGFAGCQSNAGWCPGGCGGGYAVMMFELMHWRGVATCTEGCTAGCVPYASGAVKFGSGDTTACPAAGADAASCASPSASPELLMPTHGGQCITFPGTDVGGVNASYAQYRARREIHLNGPVTASMRMCEAFHTFFANTATKDGVFAADCAADGEAASEYLGMHDVVLVGWGVDETAAPHVPYWWAKNSWGEGWGDGGYFRIARGNDTAGIESAVCYINPQTEVLSPHGDPYDPRGHAVFQTCASGPDKGGPTLCEPSNNDGGAPVPPPPRGASGAWVASAADAGSGRFHPAVDAAAQFAVSASMSAGTTPAYTVLAAHAQPVAGVNRRLLVRMGTGAGAIVLEARVHRDLAGGHSLLADTIKHSCAAVPVGVCTAPAACCGVGGGADACGACIASEMAAEVAPAVPTAPALSPREAEIHAQGEAKGKAEGEAHGALVGSLATLGACATAFLVFNGAKRARARRGATRPITAATTTTTTQYVEMVDEHNQL